MFETLGRFTYRRRRLVLALTGIFVAVGLAWGTSVFGSLANGGFDAPDTEAANAVATIEQTVGRTGTDVIVLYDGGSKTVADPAFRQSVESHLSGLPAGRRDRHRRRTGAPAPRRSSPRISTARTPY